MEEKNLENKSSKEDELWKMRQSVYSSVAQHCDGILDVMKNYSLKNMKEFIEAKLENRECFNKESNTFAQAAAETSAKHGSGRKALLSDEISKLKFSIEKLKEREAVVFDAQSRKAELKYEPVNGCEYIRLQNELKDLRNDILSITNETSALERRNGMVAMDEDFCQDIASKNSSSYYEDSLQSPSRSYSRDSCVSSSTLNQYQENVEQDNKKGYKLEHENLHAKYQNIKGKPPTLDRNKTQESSRTNKEASESQKFVYKPPKYFKQKQTE
ncbi:hypothetical protein LSTR_LSTR006550 [Laodelphax striatellus]|uniref:Uncharacterized protein n=1 Tax=Laodelphax striatellus TaxID=195883 RepID=A0A482WG89_LAOST|nr:hypothetical protein LSTR_LSTR006550 [Laodelphax striatellus]